MPGLKTTQYGSGDFTWLLNTDGLDEAITAVAPIAGFTAGTHYPNGYLPSGLPVRVDARGNVRPWADAAGARLGFLKGDHKVTGDAKINISFVARGNIKTAKLPIAFTVPSTELQPQFAFWS